MTMYHGNLFYAVKSRDVGTFGGHAKSATIKIYRSTAANFPACILDQPGQIAEFEGLMFDSSTREVRDMWMGEFVKYGG
jgi:hypothetical protein